MKSAHGKTKGTGHGTGTMMPASLREMLDRSRWRRVAGIRFNLGHPTQKAARRKVPLVFAIGSQHVIPQAGRPGDRAFRGFGTVQKDYRRIIEGVGAGTELSA